MLQDIFTAIWEARGQIVSLSFIKASDMLMRSKNQSFPKTKLVSIASTVSHWRDYFHMHAFKSVWLAGLVSLAAGTPASRSTSTPPGTPTTTLSARHTSVTTLSAQTIPVTYTVGCGCWNLCTLEQIVDQSLICPELCGL